MPDASSPSETSESESKPTQIANQNAAPAFGWSAYAERLNGRFAMIGFIALLVLELWTRQDFFTWLGLP